MGISALLTKICRKATKSAPERNREAVVSSAPRNSPVLEKVSKSSTDTETSKRLNLKLTVWAASLGLAIAPPPIALSKIIKAADRKTNREEIFAIAFVRYFMFNLVLRNVS